MTAHLHRSLRLAGKSGVGWFRSTNQRLDESDAYLAVFLLSRAILALLASSFDVISPMHACCVLRLYDVKVEAIRDDSWKFLINEIR